MTKVFPSGSNTFVPSMEASNKMVVDFSRNPKSFKLSDYCQYVPAKKSTGLYLEMTVEMAGRILDSDGTEMAWPYGADAPSGEGSEESFEFLAFTTKRYAPAFRIPQEAHDQADWEVLARYSRMATQRAMTLRTLRAITALTTTGSYPSGHTADVTDISGVTGEWDLSTTSRMDIKRCLDHAAEKIMLATLGAVQPSDLVLVINPTVAKRISICQEIRDHIKQSPVAERTVKGNLGPHNNFGMPETLYDYKVVVENTVRVTTRKGATTSKSFVLPVGYAALVSRPGELEGVEGEPSFSTLTCFLKEELTVESKHDTDNRRYLGRVVDDYAPILTAPISGYLFQNPLS